ncbi:Cu-Zn family superoxide dismutase [Paenibacillus anaericanus]|uniref:superoxide dismutase family protein n=1 Tax=Paenibacillus anaericanus TaxID=170367 RepID=UPI0027834224|nr:superoxide dismutase family protein [Paenibacillus anaericanus]MDQ0086891.1 Cu-Zn family superoxide dismutase [Paenibacillus anaericanus]
MKLRKSTLLTVIVLLFIATTGCEAQETFGKVTAAKDSPVSQQPITTDIINGKGEKIGTAKFTQLAKGVQIDVSASGLKPGLHGIHIHETGKCEIPDFKSAGSHFNPSEKEHGYDNPKGEHAGDLANLVADANGNAQAQFVLTTVTLQKGQSDSLIRTGGTALVIHEDPDDMHTDPSGNSGNRIGCAVIQ